MGTTPAATMADEPAELAPAVCRVSHGLRTGPSRGCSALGEKPYSLSRLFPSGTSPVARYIRAKSPSRFTGTGSQASAPFMVGSPAKSTLSLSQVGTPAKKPGRGSRASSRARSNASWAMPLSSGCTRSARAMAASTTSGIDTSPACSASTRPTASCSPRASSVKAWKRWSVTAPDI